MGFTLNRNTIPNF